MSITFNTIDRSSAPEPTQVQEYIRNFQATSNLPETGVLDDETQRKIDRTLQNNNIKIKDVISASSAIQDLITLIATMESRRDTTPNNFSDLDETKLNALTSIHNILQYTTNAEIIFPPEVRPATRDLNNLQADDRFFSPQIYDALNSSEPNEALQAIYDAEVARATAAGERVNSAQFPRSVEVAMAEAKRHFHSALLDQGLTPEDGTKAILSGLVSPHMSDLKLIYDSFTSSEAERIAMATYALENNRHYANTLAKFGYFGDEIEDAVEQGGKHINDFLTIEQQIAAIANMPDWKIGGAINQYRQHMFNEMYGDLASAKGIMTIIDGEPRPLNQTDIDNAIAKYDGDAVSYIRGYHKGDYNQLRNEVLAGSLTPSLEIHPTPEPTPQIVAPEAEPTGADPTITRGLNYVSP